MIRIDQVGGKGRGIFAQRRFAKGELIERAPVVVIPDCEWEFVDETFLCEYIYWWGDQTVVGLGFASFYNHSYCPNAVYIRNFETMTLEYVALRDIEAGEEVLVNYNGDPENRDPMWFDVHP